MDDYDRRTELIRLKSEKVKQLEAELEKRKRMPHRWSQKLYPWQDELIHCRHKIQVLTAANQVGKSSTMIKKTIEWATNEEIWPELWPERMKVRQPPTQFWYLYPSAQMALAEFYDKWVPLLPPKEDPDYGWREVKVNGKFLGICFLKNKLYIYFKTYSQNVEHLQAGTAYLVVCDEEVPDTIVPELQMRVHATNGYIVFGFTATMGQPFWAEVVEERKRWKDAWVRQISLWDCMKFLDETPTAWTKDRIEHAIANCTTDAEVQRRIYGKFVKDSGLKFQQYNSAKHMKLWKPIPDGWRYYVGIDWGIGVSSVSSSGHPSGIVFVAVDPEYTTAIVERSWRGDNQTLTCQDLVEHYVAMSADIKHRISRVFYDYSAADIGTVAQRMGLSFERADKSREKGVSIINSLLKLRRLSVYTHHGRCPLDPEWVQGEKLNEEMTTLPTGNEGKLLNELTDSMRYALIDVPFDWQLMREITRAGGEGQLGLGHGEEDQHRAQLVEGQWIRYGEQFIKQVPGSDILEELDFWNETFQE